ncbi:AlpA family phage regulatory protein [Cupriavidus necator]|uniref:helix-turn-helix transcriptional regulator n=1 Tax=Cupriavidus necator TaxID=106590 RepID=UPI001892A684
MPSQIQEPRCFIRVKARAHELGVSRATLYRWVQAGRIKPPTRLASRTAGWWAGDENFWIITPVVGVQR